MRRNSPDPEIRTPVDAVDVGQPEQTVAAYLKRIGMVPSTVERPDLATLERLQQAHVTTVPFETLAIAGDPYGERVGEGVVLSVRPLYEKIVERERGGYCFELNGLFCWLLDELGYDATHAAARVASDVRIPANHLTIIVELDRRYVVDVGTGPPKIRLPLPLDGSPRTDEVGIEWRIVESERSDVPYRTEYRTPDEAEWTPRYVFDAVPRDLRYFAATNDYLQSAPESPFTGEPHLSIATEKGHRTLSGETFVEAKGSDESERTVTGDAWHATLEQAFGLRYRRK